LKFYDLFSGIGGFHIALTNAGHECVGACEIDKYATTIYKRHFSKGHIHNDAKLIDTKTLPDFDILTAGFPCQAFSIAGKRMGFKETRGTIFFEIARIIKDKQPKYLFLENVKGLLNHEKGKTFKTILDTLQELGYDVEWQTFNTKHWLPQKRDRIFIIGHLRGQGGQKIFPLGQSEEVLDKTQTKTPSEEQRIWSGYTRTIDANYWKGGSHGSLIKVGYINKDQQGMRVYSDKGISATLSANGGGWGAKTGLYMLSHKKANIKQRYQERDTTWTLDTSGNKMAIEVGDDIRRLTPKECERLQGFPDDWTAGISDTQRYKCLGNAVSVPVVEYIAKWLT